MAWCLINEAQRESWLSTFYLVSIFVHTTSVARQVSVREDPYIYS
jgi:hypothetical protein